jgi:mRNA interferase RelE/StbE
VTDARWRVQLTRAAQRDLARLDPPIRHRVETALSKLALDPQSAGQLRKLAVAPEWRLRIGDWRALLLLDHQTMTINVTRVLPRDRAYRD